VRPHPGRRGSQLAPVVLPQHWCPQVSHPPHEPVRPLRAAQAPHAHACAPWPDAGRCCCRCHCCMHVCGALRAPHGVRARRLVHACSRERHRLQQAWRRTAVQLRQRCRWPQCWPPGWAGGCAQCARRPVRGAHPAAEEHPEAAMHLRRRPGSVRQRLCGHQGSTCTAAAQGQQGAGTATQGVWEWPLRTRAEAARPRAWRARRGRASWEASVQSGRTARPASQLQPQRCPGLRTGPAHAGRCSAARPLRLCRRQRSWHAARAPAARGTATRRPAQRPHADMLTSTLPLASRPHCAAHA
jgi:hypothetical protein